MSPMRHRTARSVSLSIVVAGAESTSWIGAALPVSLRTIFSKFGWFEVRRFLNESEVIRILSVTRCSNLDLTKHAVIPSYLRCLKALGKKSTAQAETAKALYSCTRTVVAEIAKKRNGPSLPDNKRDRCGARERRAPTMAGEPMQLRGDLPLGRHQGGATQEIIVGPGTIDQISLLVQQMDKQRVVIVTSDSVLHKTPLVDALSRSLGARLALVCPQVLAHVPMDNVFAAAERAREVSADAVVSIGGGSAIDAAKWVTLLLADPSLDDGEPIRDLQALRALAEGGGPPKLHASIPHHIAIPTTASGAEFTGVLGITDPLSKAKRVIRDDRFTPHCAILDPLGTLHTPHALWNSTAIRALDHAIEALYGPGANPYTDMLAAESIRLLFRHLPDAQHDSNGVRSRGYIQVAAWFGAWALLEAGSGLSHGLGYVLGGTFGVPHGICSCVTLPAVMRWNLQSSVVAQARMAHAAGVVAPDASDERAADMAASAVQNLIAGLGLPTQLRDLGSISLGDLEQIAGLAITLPHARSNPRRPTGPNELVEMLRAAW
jgi:maleylacetate reductase